MLHIAKITLHQVNKKKANKIYTEEIKFKFLQIQTYH